ALHVRRGDSLAVVPVAKITELRLIKKSQMELGAPGGGAMAALMGTDDEVYDLTPLEFPDRLRVVQKIFLYHPPDTSTVKPCGCERNRPGRRYGCWCWHDMGRLCARKKPAASGPGRGRGKGRGNGVQ